ncbi:MAG: hypothetical protein ACFFB3_15910 [Candidatus Hodarchaeota archaeon]
MAPIEWLTFLMIAIIFVILIHSMLRQSLRRLELKQVGIPKALLQTSYTSFVSIIHHCNELDQRNEAHENCLEKIVAIKAIAEHSKEILDRFIDESIGKEPATTQER